MNELQLWDTYCALHDFVLIAISAGVAYLIWRILPRDWRDSIRNWVEDNYQSFGEKEMHLRAEDEARKLREQHEKSIKL